MQRIVVCCGVLRRVAACCGVLRCVAVCCSVLQWVAAWCCVTVAVLGSVLQCVATAQKWKNRTLVGHEWVNFRFLVLAGSEWIFTQIIE